MGHPVPSPPVLTGEVLPKVSESATATAAFFDECKRAYREVSEQLGGDPLATTQDLMRVVLDPWSPVKHIPKKYRTEEPATPPTPTKGQLALKTRSS